MAGAILYESNQIFITRHAGRFFRNKLFQQGADGFDDFNIGFFIVAADIVGFADNTLGNNLIQCSCDGLDKQPVADLLPYAVNGQWFAVERVQNHQGMSFPEW